MNGGDDGEAPRSKNVLLDAVIGGAGVGTEWRGGFPSGGCGGRVGIEEFLIDRGGNMFRVKEQFAARIKERHKPLSENDRCLNLGAQDVECLDGVASVPDADGLALGGLDGVIGCEIRSTEDVDDTGEPFTLENGFDGASFGIEHGPDGS